ncbi:dehydrogenase [Janibacter cremeus]|uniref:zinc-dependent alcohol dehydrogenase n=1 Tax=Janibacter cremeus TaxID=1285192 RepID=UPI0023FA019D|nr:dehydrogenase [Janibacter cremeus]WEV78828.1 dehydrogenase [Janibacter cremeus]
MSARAHDARAYWVLEPGRGEIRSEPLPDPGPDEVLVRALCSGISRGTEALVFRGEVPPDQYEVMRAPLQQGDFPGPVKYGYLAVGVVEEGPEHLVDTVVFSLHPHQDRYVVPADAVVPVPDDVPPQRAVLTGAVETAVNGLWDVPPLIGDRVSVVGGGMVGCCAARLLARFAGVEVTLVDVDAARAPVAEALGVGFARPEEAKGGQDLVVHTSASSAGLQTSLDLLRAEGTVLDLSWYGTHGVALDLGGAYHSGRLRIRSSQVGTVANVRRGSRSMGDRKVLALDLLRDPAFDVLLTGATPFADLPQVMADVCEGRLPAICHVVTYEHEEGT